MTDVLVIGAGMAGLTAAREISRAGFSVHVVEARDRVGGRVFSVRDFANGPVEGGAEFVHGVGAATWPEIRAAGLAVRPCPTVRHSMLALGKRPRWLPSSLLHPGTWRSFTILRRARRFRGPDLSGREFLERQGYRGRALMLGEMALAGHLPGSPDEIGLRGLLEDGVLHLETGVNHRVVEGYDALPSHIGIDVEVETGFAVERVRWLPSGVAVVATDGRERSARVGISTLPLGVVKAGGVRFEPALPEGKRSALAGLRSGPVLKVLLRFEERFWPRWLALLACGTGPVNLFWPAFYGADADHAVLIAYATGPRAARLSSVTQDEAAALTVEHLERLFPGHRARQALVACRRVDWSEDPFAHGGYSFVLPGGAGSRAGLKAADTGALLWAGSATETVPIAETVEAAYLSGLRAAREAVHLLATG